MRYVVCYDIANNSRRKRVADTLDSYGDRMQESVFEIAAPRLRFQACLERLKMIINPKEDSLVVYSLCSSCDRNAQYLGVSADEPRTGEEVVFIV